MEAYRDQYATLFNNGKKVVVIGISVDPDTALHNWARESGFPGSIRQRHGPGSRKGCMGRRNAKYNTRNVFIIGPDGKIASRMMKFNVLAGDA